MLFTFNYTTAPFLGTFHWNTEVCETALVIRHDDHVQIIGDTLTPLEPGLTPVRGLTVLAHDHRDRLEVRIDAWECHITGVGLDATIIRPRDLVLGNCDVLTLPEGLYWSLPQQVALKGVSYHVHLAHVGLECVAAMVSRTDDLYFGWYVESPHIHHKHSLPTNAEEAKRSVERDLLSEPHLERAFPGESVVWHKEVEFP